MKRNLILFFCLFLLNASLAQPFEWIRTYEGHEAPVSYVAFRPEDNRIFSGDESGLIISWDMHTGRAIKKLNDHDGLITHITFSKDADKMGTASYDGTIKIWDMKTMKVEKTFRNTRLDLYDNLKGNEPTFIVFAPDGQTIYYGGYNLEVIKANLSTGKTEQVFESEEYALTCGLVSPDEKHLVVASANKMHFIPFQNKEKKWSLAQKNSFDDYVCEVAFRPEREELAAWGYGGEVQFWNFDKKKSTLNLSATNKKGTSNMAFSGDGEFLVTGNSGSITKLWSVREQKVIQELGAHEAEVVAFAYSVDGNYIVTGGRDGLVNLWSRKLPDEEIEKKERPKDFGDRKIELQHQMKVENQEIELLFWDQEKLDNDSISVFFNGEWILENHKLERTKTSVFIKLNKGKNYVLIHALNEGEISPNTVAVTVNDGRVDRVFSIRTDMERSGAIKLNF